MFEIFNNNFRTIFNNDKNELQFILLANKNYNGLGHCTDEAAQRIFSRVHETLRWPRHNFYTRKKELIIRVNYYYFFLFSFSTAQEEKKFFNCLCGTFFFISSALLSTKRATRPLCTLTPCTFRMYFLAFGGY